MAMDPLSLARAVLQIFFILMEQAGKTKEEKDEIYNRVRAEYESKEDPSTLRDTIEE